MLATGNFPAHRTISEFRRRHLEDFQKLFVEVVKVARELGLVNFGWLSIDGTKVRANASKRKTMTYGRMEPEAHFDTDSVDDGVDLAFLEVFQVQLAVGVYDDGVPVEMGRVYSPGGSS